MFLAALLLFTPADAARRAKAPEPPPPPPPQPDGWFDPARDAWSPEALRTALTQLDSKAAPSKFLGDTTAMARFTPIEWAWFADGFEPEDYTTVAVASPTNGMGRFHLVGELLLRDEQVTALRGVTKAWKKAEAGTEAPLVVYTNLRWALTSELGAAWVVENLGVDADKNVVFRTQSLVGAAPPLGTAAVPDDKTRFGYLAEAADEASADLAAALKAAGEATRAGTTLPHGPPVRLHCERADLMSRRAEAFGPAIQAQVHDAVFAAADTSVALDVRIQRVERLGALGAAAGVPLVTSILLDETLDAKLRAAAAWSAGEIGHPNALPTLEKVKGVDSYRVKTAVTKIDRY